MKFGDSSLVWATNTRHNIPALKVDDPVHYNLFVAVKWLKTTTKFGSPLVQAREHWNTVENHKQLCSTQNTGHRCPFDNQQFIVNIYRYQLSVIITKTEQYIKSDSFMLFYVKTNILRKHIYHNHSAATANISKSWCFNKNFEVGRHFSKDILVFSGMIKFISKSLWGLGTP